MSDLYENKLDDNGLWQTLSEVAKSKGISRAAISQRVSRLEEHRLITTRPGPGRTKLVNIVEYDRVVGQVGDLGREQGAATRRGEDNGGEGGGSASSAYTREQTKRMAYLAEISRLDLEERLGSLVSAAELRSVIEAAGKAVAKAIDSIDQDEEILLKLARSEDPTAFRRGLRDTAHRIRRDTLSILRVDLASRKAANGEGVDGSI